MIIECHNCKARVDAEEVGVVEYEEAFWQERVYLLRCPVCKFALVGQCTDIHSEEGVTWSQLVRVYPKPVSAASLSVYSGNPKVVIDSLRKENPDIKIALD